MITYIDFEKFFEYLLFEPPVPYMLVYSGTCFRLVHTDREDCPLPYRSENDCAAVSAIRCAPCVYYSENSRDAGC